MCSLTSARSVRKLVATAGLMSAAVLGGALPGATPAGAATGSADLSVAVAHSPSNLTTGDEVTINVTAANAGPGVASDVVVGLGTGYSWRFLNTTLPESCGFGGENGAVICAIGNLPPGSSFTVALTLTPYSSGMFAMQGAVASDTPDPDIEDRSVTHTVMVQRGPSQTEAALGLTYEQVLGRAASPAEIKFWVDRWNQVPYQERYRIPLAIIDSAESRRIRVDAAYLATLGRAATPADVDFWAGQLAGRHTYETFQAALIGSPEFASKNGSNAAAVTSAAYGQIVGRSATPAEVNAWTSAVARGTSITQLVQQIQTTTEARDRVIHMRVNQVLERPASDFDRLVWISNLNDGYTHDSQWAFLYASGELLSRFPYEYEPYPYPVY